VVLGMKAHVGVDSKAKIIRTCDDNANVFEVMMNGVPRRHESSLGSSKLAQRGILALAD
jgi:hypothetical protein